MSLHQIASSIFYKVIMTKCFNYPPQQIEKLGIAVAFHWDETINNTTIQIKNLTLDNLQENNYLKFFIHYTIIMFGDYTDHCRCHWVPSQGVNETIFQKLFELFKIPDEKQVELVKLVIQLVDTEFESYIGNIDDISNHTQMMHLCSKQLKNDILKHSKSYLKILIKQLMY